MNFRHDSLNSIERRIKRRLGRHNYDLLKAQKLTPKIEQHGGYKIRDAQVRKVPYMLVVGGREAEQGTVSLRARTGEDRGAVPVDRVVTELTAEIAARTADLSVGRS